MGKLAFLFMFAAGLTVAIVGLASASGPEIRIMALVVGTVTVISGLVLAVKSSFGQKARSKETGRDTPAIVRIAGAFLGLASLALPYIRIPLSPEAQRTSHSFVDLLGLLQGGNQIEGGFLVMLFMGVVVAGSFIAFFHHAGGYVVLLGSMAFTFITMQALHTDLPSIATREFMPGLYIAVVASFVIISSSLMRSTSRIESRPPPGGKSWD